MQLAMNDTTSNFKVLLPSPTYLCILQAITRYVRFYKQQRGNHRFQIKCE